MANKYIVCGETCELSINKINKFPPLKFSEYYIVANLIKDFKSKNIQIFVWCFFIIYDRVE